ncbi:substrate-binding domain-containing protein [Nocardioides conyzicola]|uniref:PBP domain-containing protein n=1 Tax=Nocardioides conyzicola TaxID=1651781 RepID=A0ABP8XP93_9ACTN
MSKRRTAVAITLAGVVSAGVLAAALPSQADPAPTATDVVGVGSDIIQNSVDFLGDGYSWSGGSLPGYNTAGNKNRLISFSATADGNGRNAFTDPALGTVGKLNPTIVLRAGTSPVQRPNGGGAGLNALIADGNATNGGRISFVRSPNKPTSAQQTSAGNSLHTALHTVQFADDKQYIATATTTNAPATLTTGDLVKIYSGTWTTWGDVAAGVTPGAHTGETIVPLLPQDGAGVQTIFLNALKAANGGTAITLGGAVQKVQQNDPTTITALPDATRKNAIVPFPKGRYELLGAGFFHDPTPVYNSESPAPALSNAGIQLLTSGSNFIADIPYYVVFRESDVDSDTPWQPGSTLNWVQTLFYNPDYDPEEPGDVTPPFVASAAGKAILESIGLTPLYVDHGNTTTG